jgi:translation initiation factor 2 subunit 2
LSRSSFRREPDERARSPKTFERPPARSVVAESYSAMLERARSKLPPVQEVLRREPAHVIGYLARELGCPGVLDLPRGVLKSRIPKETLQQRIREYTEKYVICSECKRPDTHLKRDGRLTLLICEACGAQRPVTVRRVVAPEKPKTPVVVGEVYRLTIEDVGKRGDGVAKKEGFVIFVTGATQRGATINAKITKVLGNNAYAIVQP